MKHRYKSESALEATCGYEDARSSAAPLMSSGRMNALFGRIAFAFANTFVVNDARTLWMRGDKLLLVTIIAIGALLRMWGLGAVGLHGEDEHTTTLAALHILQDGMPRFPSGMFYSRAIAQSYLIAASVFAFGESEWAIRLPSALCGVLVIPLAYWVGRRFLLPVWNLAFVTTVALSPELILISKNARMYIFFVAAMAAYTALVFRWERTWRLRDLCWAVCAMAVALQFQILAVFGVLLLFFPPLVQGDARRLRQAIGAAAGGVLAYVAIDRWNGNFYFERAQEFGAKVVQSATVSMSYGQTSTTLIFLASASALAVVWWSSATARKAVLRGVIFALFAVALAAQLTFNYHIAAIAYLGALIVVRRANLTMSLRLLPPLLISVLIGIYHWNLLRQTGVESVRLVLGAVLGRPSVWAYVNFAKLSYAAAAIAAMGASHALYRLARRQRVADYWWLFVLGVWIPLLVIGFFQWYPAPRYTIGCLLPLLLCAFATLQDAAKHVARRQVEHPEVFQSVVACGAVLFSVNPTALASAIDSRYDTYPDHKGAAEFMKARALGPHDRILAEDVLMQTYYLKHLDYWLIARPVAIPFVERVGDRYVDGYTHTPVISSGTELQALLNSEERGTLYVITSAEPGGGEAKYIEGEGIYEVLRSGAFQRVFVGRDGRTLVWISAPRNQGVGAHSADESTSR